MLVPVEYPPTFIPIASPETLMSPLLTIVALVAAAAPLAAIATDTELAELSNTSIDFPALLVAVPCCTYIPIPSTYPETAPTFIVLSFVKVEPLVTNAPTFLEPAVTVMSALFLTLTPLSKYRASKLLPEFTANSVP